ncbi:UNVERIFIED_CONTAM: hypothetical protein FKN15_016982 [Acipenser sinensis]
MWGYLFPQGAGEGAPPRGDPKERIGEDFQQDSLTVPIVELYSPGLFEGDSDWTEPVLVLCLVRDTSPWRHRVNWTIGAEAAVLGSAEDGEIEPDGSYSVRSYITISADQWNSSTVKCEVYNNITNVTEKVSASHRRQGELRS